MLVNGVSLFDNRFKNYRKSNVNQEVISFSAKKPELPQKVGEVVGGVGNKAKEKARRVFEGYESLRKKGKIKEGDNNGGRPPGMPESD